MPANALNLIVVGNNHADFAVPSVFLRLLSELAKRKIPCGYLVEGPSDESIAASIASTERGRYQNSLFKKAAPEIQQYYRKDPVSQVRIFLWMYGHISYSSLEQGWGHYYRLNT